MPQVLASFERSTRTIEEMTCDVPFSSRRFRFEKARLPGPHMCDRRLQVAPPFPYCALQS